MDFRQAAAFLEERGGLIRIEGAKSPVLEMARTIRMEEPRALSMTDGAGRRVVSGIARRDTLAACLGIDRLDLEPRILAAMDAAPPPLVEGPPLFREPSGGKATFDELPVATHFKGDGGPYITGGVFFFNDPRFGPNASFHRIMLMDGKRGAVRVVEGRGLHAALENAKGPISCAVCIGTPVQMLVAAAMPLPPGRDELAAANALATTPHAAIEGIRVPSESEIVLFGTLNESSAPEGPFVDITGTQDFVRKQPVFELERIFLRDDFLYHAIHPAGSEHRFLMGFPRQVAMHGAISAVCGIRGVRLTDGGSGWLHGVVSIVKTGAEDAKRAASAAFEAHPSLKHVVVVDDDIDPSSPESVEWAIATRFQADRDLTVLSGRPSSSLDPSALHRQGRRSTTSKMILDATKKTGGPFDLVTE